MNSAPATVSWLPSTPCPSAAMELFYYRDVQNFGDQLNAWMWPQLLSGKFAAGSPSLFLGIGTVLKPTLPQADAYIVMGAGGGYGEFPLIDDRWHIYAVRGPLTASELGLPVSAAITDPACLISRLPVPPPNPAITSEVGFIPHWSSLWRMPWAEICADAGVHFISPDREFTAVAADIQGCQVVITEAMHGAITADALRIPWVPVSFGVDFNEFKWRDWQTSMELAAPIVELPHVRPLVPFQTGESRGRAIVRKSINAPARLLQLAALRRRLRELAQRIKRGDESIFLSRDEILSDRCDELQRRIDRLNSDLDREQIRGIRRGPQPRPPFAP